MNKKAIWNNMLLLLIGSAAIGVMSVIIFAEYKNIQHSNLPVPKSSYAVGEVAKLVLTSELVQVLNALNCYPGEALCRDYLIRISNGKTITVLAVELKKDQSK